MTPIEVYTNTLFWLMVLTFFFTIMRLMKQDRPTGALVADSIIYGGFIIWGAILLTS